MESHEEDLNLPDYMSHPILHKYVGRMHLLIDELYAETADIDREEVVEQLCQVLMTVHRRIIYEGELAELDSILRMHFPSYYNACDESSIPALTDYPLSTSN